MPADIRCDITDWDYKTYNPKNFDYVWASSPCTTYSIAKTTSIWKAEQANQISQSTIEIIRYLHPKYWLIENPRDGRLTGQESMDGIPFKDIDYCKYGMPYRKRTNYGTISTAGNQDPYVSQILH